MARTTDTEELEAIARQVRRDIVQTVHTAGTGHVGGPLSAVEILVGLYFAEMHVDPCKPGWPDRDRFVLSKGHSSVALYAVLAERGYFARDELRTFDQLDSRLQAHPDMTVLPGLDMSTGSLGQGLSTGLGMALAARLDGHRHRTFVMLGDGECQEGQVWEAAHVAARYRVASLVAIVDWNGLQQYGWHRPGDPPDRRANPMDGLVEKWQAFGWRAREIDGHSFQEITAALAETREDHGRPTCLVARTVKGKGISYMEGDYLWHSRPISDAELEAAMRELGA